MNYRKKIRRLKINVKKSRRANRTVRVDIFKETTVTTKMESQSVQIKDWIRKKVRKNTFGQRNWKRKVLVGL